MIVMSGTLGVLLCSMLLSPVQQKPPKGATTSELLQPPTEKEWNDAQTEGWVLELYDIRGLTTEAGSTAGRSADDITRLLRERVELSEPQVTCSAGVLVVRANPGKQTRVRNVLDDLRRFVVPVRATSMSGRLTRVAPSGDAASDSSIGGVRIETLSNAEVSKFEAMKHTVSGRVALPSRIETSKWRHEFKDVTIRQHEPLEEGEAFVAGNAVDRTWLVGYDTTSDVEGHPDGVPTPRFEKLSEGTRLEVSYAVVGDGSDASAFKVSVNGRQSRVARPVPTRATDHGLVHSPSSETTTVSATLLVESGGGFIVVFERAAEGEPDDAVLVLIQRKAEDDAAEGSSSKRR